MVWYGMVWYDMVWYGMVWHGMVWYGVWYGMVWCMVWYGVWYGMVWYSKTYHGIVWFSLVCMVWYGVLWYGVIATVYHILCFFSSQVQVVSPYFNPMVQMMKKIPVYLQNSLPNWFYIIMLRCEPISIYNICWRKGFFLKRIKRLVRSARLDKLEIVFVSFVQACSYNKCIDLTPNHSGGNRIDGR